MNNLLAIVKLYEGSSLEGHYNTTYVAASGAGTSHASVVKASVQRSRILRASSISFSLFPLKTTLFG